MDTITDSRPEQGESQLREDLDALRNDLKMLAADVAELGRNQVQRVREGAEDLARAGGDAVEDLDRSLAVSVRERPVQSLAIAFFAGYLVSAITR